jgi:benzoyl-CoA reductase/2-hydroxyglutaryl-CoA dehydratase subunit BcrC/BadD/HgdB
MFDVFDNNYRQDVFERSFREGLELKENGWKVIGVYCAFTPKEIIAAAGAVPVALCSGSQEPIPEAERHLPRNLCPLIKATYGHALRNSCPYMAEVDFIFADATCDGKKKMFELLGQIKPLYLLQLPQTCGTRASLDYWLEELRKVSRLTEQITGVPVTDAALWEQITLYNRCRKTVNEVFGLNKGRTPLLTGREISAITEEFAGFECRLERRIENVERAVSVARQRQDDGRYVTQMMNKPRILLTGCPTTNNKVLDIIEEECGAVVVAMENCGGLKTSSFLVAEDGDPMRALAEKYLHTPCPCMTPNSARMDLIEQLVKEFAVDGVVELTWEACHTYHIETHWVKQRLTDGLGTPYIQICTDYSQHDTQQIKLRIEAFLEMIR